MPIKNTDELRKLLLEAIEDVKDGELEPVKAAAISNLSNRVIQSAKLDLDVLRFVGKTEGAEIKKIPSASLVMGEAGKATQENLLKPRIMQMTSEGISAKEIAQKLDVSVEQVMKMRKKEIGRNF